MKRYKLLKDLPTFNAGDEFELRDDGCLYLVDAKKQDHWKNEVMAYHQKTLERFPNILEEWFEEMGKYYYLDNIGDIIPDYGYVCTMNKIRKEIGNYFDTEEEAELAIRKLKAWKRLKDKGFRFRYWDTNHHNLGTIDFFMPDVVADLSDYREDLDLLFGDEE